MENYFPLLTGIIKKYIAMNGGKKLFVISSKMNLSAQEYQELLALDDASAIVSEQNPNVDSPRFGLLSADGFWQLPFGKHEILLFLGASVPEIMGMKRSIDAIKNGIHFYADFNESPTLNHKSFLKYFLLQLHERIKEKFKPTLKLKNIGKIPDFHAIKDKIIVINSSLAAGGAERQIVNTLLGLHQIGVQAELWCTHLHNDDHKFYLPHLEGKLGVSSVLFRKLQLLYEIFVNQSQILLELSELRDSERFQYLKKVCPMPLFQDVHDFATLYMEAKPEIVYVWQDYVNITAGLAAWMVGVPKVIMITRSINPTNFLFYNRHMQPIYQFLAAQENCVLLNNSEAGARDYENWSGLEEGRIQVLHNGLYEPESLIHEEISEWCEAYKLPFDKKVVGTIMRLSEEKKPFLWIEVASKVKESYPDCVFLIVGDGPLRAQMEQQIAGLGLQDSFYMPGRLQDVRFPLACMDIFLLTSRVEGLPNVLIEAQMMGVPVITTPAGGSIEAIVPGMSGHCSQTHGTEELASYVLQELESGALQANHEQIKTAAQQRFNVQRMVAETLTFFGK